MRILYIMGLYRSGSTILDILLGNEPGVVGVGELRNLAAAGWEGENVCSCGEPVATCAFWRDVRRDWEQRTGPDQMSNLATLQEQFDRLRGIWRTLTPPPALAGGLKRYLHLTGELYRSIGTVAQAELVVDSSKYPARALALLRDRSLDVRIVHLVRDGRAVIWSMKRKLNTDLAGRTIELAHERIALETSRQWALINFTSDLVLRRARDRGIRVRYEDLVSHPDQELSRIGQIAGLEPGALLARVEAGAPLEVGHMVAGNRVRMNDKVVLRPDLEWPEKLPAEDRETFQRTAGWLAKRYGYV